MSVDVGTSVVKSILSDLEGRQVASGSCEIALIYPQAGWTEQDPDELWHKTARAIRLATKKSNVRPGEIKCIGITNQRETIIPVSKSGAALRNAISWRDARTKRQVDTIKESVGMKKVYHITGLRPDSYFSAVKELWIKENETKVYNKVYKWLLVGDWTAFKLTGKWGTDWSNASRTMLFDIGKRGWSEELIDSFGLEASHMPDPFPPGTILGEVTQEAARKTGLNSGTPVALCGGDAQCSALGVGACQPGRMQVNTGTATNSQVFIEMPVFDPEMVLLVSCHAVPGKYTMEASTKSSGIIYRWFRDNFGRDIVAQARKGGMDPYALMDEAAQKVPAGSEGLLLVPYWDGSFVPYWNPLDRGIIIGVRTTHGRDHFIRAVMEGIAYETRRYIGVINKLVKRVRLPSIGDLRLTGGGAKSKIWNQIYTDVIGSRALVHKVIEASSLGATILASLAVNIYTDVDRAVEQMVKVDYVLEPNAENLDRYNKLYKIYSQAYESVSNLNRDISKLYGE